MAQQGTPGHNRARDIAGHNRARATAGQNRAQDTAGRSFSQRRTDNINSRKPAKRTLLLTIDFCKPFYPIPRYLLIKNIYNTELHNNTKQWLANYLSGRQAYVHYSGKSSKTLNIPNGVPQGSVLSPTLFNLYMHDIPQPPENIHIASYADDITITSTHSNTNTYSTQGQDYMDTITTWMNTNRPKIARTKSTATLLTSHNAVHQHKPTVILQNTTIPHTQTTKILGVTFNTSRSFSQHMDEVSEKCNKRLNTLRTLTGTNFGQDKETLTLIYKQYIRSVISYASLAWAPIASKTKLNKLQTIQNKGLKIITGSTRTSSTTHVHAETQVLTIQQHLDMRGTQFLASAINNPNSPCHYMFHHAPTHRVIAMTPHRYCTDLLHSLPPRATCERRTGGKS
ncbi:Reverse transcriptase domain [Trinorchestia longiramus]|nr:Reverse transcriptase domain [Trinorchestia longiramus]